MSLSSNIIAPLELRLAEGQPYYSYTKKNTSSDERFDSENHLLESVLWDSKNKNTGTQFVTKQLNKGVFRLSLLFNVEIIHINNINICIYKERKRDR